MSRGGSDRMSTGPDRREIRIATLRTGAAILVVGVVYGFLPVDSGPVLTGVVAVVVGLLALGVLLVVQLRRIVTHPRPILRAARHWPWSSRCSSRSSRGLRAPVAR